MEHSWRGAAWPLGLVALAVLLAYGLRVDDLTVRGEESRRATVAMEMLATGDWVVPRQQGDPWFMSSRPPLQAWVIAGCATLRGELDVLAVRLPSILAVFLTAVLLYAYAATFLSRAGAFAAALGFVTFGQVIELGRLGETDALFTLFLSASLVAWHAGYTRRWPPARTWVLAYVAAALATLTKGPQGPVYFALTVGTYLLGTGNLRFAFTRAHLGGIAVYALLVGAWLVPFHAELGWRGVRHVFTGDVRLYLSDWSLPSIAKHVTGYPLSVLGGLLPWSLLLLVYFGRGMRAAAPPHVRFFLGAILVTLPTVWFVPGAKTRFFMPLYPCFAILLGIAVDRLAFGEGPRPAWRRFLAVLACLMGLAAVAVPVVKPFSDDRVTSVLSWPLVIAVSLVSGALALITWRARDPRVALVSVAAFAGLLMAGPATTVHVSQANRADLAMAELAEVLPPDVSLVSFDPVHHLFAYYHGRPIERVERADAAALEAPYACAMQPLPEPYEELARVFCGRKTKDARNETNTVIVGRRRADPPRSP